MSEEYFPSNDLYDENNQYLADLGNGKVGCKHCGKTYNKVADAAKHMKTLGIDVHGNAVEPEEEVNQTDMLDVPTVDELGSRIFEINLTEYSKTWAKVAKDPEIMILIEKLRKFNIVPKTMTDYDLIKELLFEFSRNVGLKIQFKYDKDDLKPTQERYMEYISEKWGEIYG